MKEINILSIGWRSHWLAQKLSILGLDVRLYEFNNQILNLANEELDGPFPLNIDSRVPVEFLNTTQKNERFEKLKDGFCMSTPSGNISSQNGTYDAVVKAMKEEFYKKALKEESFWLDDFLKSFGKTKFKKSSLWNTEAEAFNPQGSLFLRRSEDSDYAESLEVLAQKRVKVYLVTEQDLPGLMAKVKSESKKWLMGLTVSELKLLTGVEVENLEESYGWHRNRFKHKPGVLKGLPTWSVWVESPFKPWKESNNYILIKGKDSDVLDVWSIEQVYSKEKVENSVKESSEFLKNKLSYAEFEFIESSDFKGPLKTLFPVSNRFTELNDRLYNWNSPREWKGYNTHSIYTYQKNLVELFDKGTGALA